MFHSINMAKVRAEGLDSERKGERGQKKLKKIPDIPMQKQP